MAELLYSRLIHVYLVYGLGFFILGLAVALEATRVSQSRFSRAMPYLAAFGLLHGLHEWVEMLEMVGVEVYGFVPPIWWGFGRLVLLSLSFTALVAFGVYMLYTSPTRPSAGIWGTGAMFTLYAAGALALGVRFQGTDWLLAADAWTRYSMGVPGALLASAALHSQWRLMRAEEVGPLASNFLWTAIVFLIYGLGTQAFVPQAEIFPAQYINTELFREVTGIPVQASRSILAMLMAFFMIRGLRAFEIERRRQLTEAQEREREAIERRDALRGELLKRTVAAQEEERTRLARELHDDTLQVLTGLSAGLQGTEMLVEKQPEKARAQLLQLSEMSAHAIGELRRLIVDLRPSVLDDMGLVPAVRWYAESVANRTGLQVQVSNLGIECRLPEELETTLFRISQEGLNNAARHARASRVEVRMRCDRVTTRLEIEDDGVGFDTASVTRNEWGLAGIQERIELAGGAFEIDSAPGQGTTLRVAVPAGLTDDAADKEVEK